MNYEYYDERVREMATKEGADIEWLKEIDEILRKADTIKTFEVWGRVEGWVCAQVGARNTLRAYEEAEKQFKTLKEDMGLLGTIKVNILDIEEVEEERE